MVYIARGHRRCNAQRAQKPKTLWWDSFCLHVGSVEIYSRRDNFLKSLGVRKRKRPIDDAENLREILKRIS